MREASFLLSTSEKTLNHRVEIASVSQVDESGHVRSELGADQILVDLARVVPHLFARRFLVPVYQISAHERVVITQIDVVLLRIYRNWKYTQLLNINHNLT